MERIIVLSAAFVNIKLQQVDLITNTAYIATWVGNNSANGFAAISIPDLKRLLEI